MIVGVIIAAIVLALLVVGLAVSYISEGTHTGPITMEDWEEWYDSHGLYQSDDTNQTTNDNKEEL